jgi:hypothetical protein
MQRGGSASWIRISSDAFEVLFVYPLFGNALTFSKGCGGFQRVELFVTRFVPSADALSVHGLAWDG